MNARRKLETPNLRSRLVLIDALALGIAWVPMEVLKFGEGAPIWKLLAIHAVLIVSGLQVLHMLGLYLARVASSRTEENRRLLFATAVLGLTQVTLLRVIGVTVPMQALVAGPVLLLILLLWFRGGYRAWLGTARAKGYYLRDVLVIGTNDDAATLVAMLHEHPEAGFRVAGVVGDALEASVHGLADLYRGPTSQLLDTIDSRQIPGVICVAGAAPAKQMLPLLSALSDRGVHIQVSTGLQGMSHGRLRATPVAYQSIYYIEPAHEARGAQMIKRSIDIVIASIALVATAPIMAVTALVIRVADRGPVLFRQARVGRNGVEFHMLKFRSMVVGAEQQLGSLIEEGGNDRSGPLFKLEADPRVTRVGRIIRATSIDELPQLLNVLRGEMSIVGPRPALQSEVAQFDTRHLDRLRMRPGITGLWQVEARDNPHFGAYRRLDLFYVDNWSLNLDLVILVATAEQVVAKAVRSLVPHAIRRRASAPRGVAGPVVTHRPQVAPGTGDPSGRASIAAPRA
jgi:exopolysaccharide biosynthesis polyprenyl glycosylphosphotransferase